MKYASRPQPQINQRGKFRGAGGLMGGGGASTPKPPREDPDSLRSTQYAHVLDVLCEGPIPGLVNTNFDYFVGAQNPAAGIFFNQTPLATDANSATMNYNGVMIRQGVGQAVQGGDWMVGGAEDTINAGINLRHGIPFTFAIDDPGTSRVVIAIRIPQLEYQDSKGNILNYQVSFGFAVNLNDTGWSNYGNHTISGKCTSDYVREYVLILPKSAAPWNDHWSIQVLRTSNDDSDSKHFSATVFDYYTRIVDHFFMYPYSAVVMTQIDASQLSDIPVRGYCIKGLYVPVPSNYFPDKRTYSRNPANGADTGTYQPWNGTFYLAWSNNPAWCFYDMCTNPRYGAGEYLGNNVDKWSLYQIAQYCDQLVPNGYGGWEPRFTCNVYIQAQQQAWKVLSDLASVFRGTLYWGQGQVVPVADMPKPIMHTFTNANVVEARFTYADSELKSRYSDAAVTWNDPTDFFNAKTQAAFDIDQRIKYGYRETKFTSYGCTSRGQARRHGLYVLATNKYEYEMVTFQTGFEAIYLRPGDVIGIVDNDRIGLRQGGRVYSVSGHNVTLDQATAAWPDGQEISFYAAKDAGAIGDYYADSNDAANRMRPSMMWKGWIYGMNGAANQTVYVQDGNGNPPPVPTGQPPSPGAEEGVTKGSIFVIGANINTPLDVPVDTYRVLSISEKERNIYEINAVHYEAGKYNLVDFGLQFQVPQYTRIPAITFVLPPNNLTAILRATISANKNTVTLNVVLNWEQPPEKNIRSYTVKVLPPHAGWTLLGETTSTTYVYPVAIPGLFTFQVCTINHAGIASQPATVSITVPDPALIKPHRISGLELQDAGNNDVYATSMPIVSWRLNSPTNSYPINSEEPYGANVGSYDPFFTNFEVVISDADTDIQGWVDHTMDLQYAITYEKNEAAWGDGLPRHKLKVSVQSLNVLGIDWPPSEIIIDNPPPPQHSSLTVAVGGGATPQRATLTWTNPTGPTALDYEQTYVYQGTANNFATAVKKDAVAGSTNTWTSQPLPTGTYWFFITAVDSFFSESAPLSVQVAMP